MYGVQNKWAIFIVPSLVSEVLHSRHHISSYNAYRSYLPQ